MKSVLISIQPKWVEKIASGEKTIEVRKTKPNLETPFKCYIYCTKTRRTGDVWTDGMVLGFDSYKRIRFCNYCEKEETFNGKVIGEFVCDRVVQFENSFYEPAFEETSHLSCVGYDELAKYLGNNDYGYGWHISDLKIYDKPKELSEFKVECPTKNQINGDCHLCKYASFSHYGNRPKCNAYLTRPPQSWCYVESLGE